MVDNNHKKITEISWGFVVVVIVFAELRIVIKKKMPFI